LLKKYRNLWVFGDSFSTPNAFVEPKDSFWMLTGLNLNVDNIYNYSWPGNSIDSVIHMLISDSDQFDWENDFFLIGVPPLARLTLISQDDKKSYHRNVYNESGGWIDQQLILCHHGLENRSFYNDPLAIRFEDLTWTEIQACRLIYLVNSWLDSQRANYILLNLSKDFNQDSPATGKFLLEKCLNHSNNMLIGKTYHGINLGINKPADYDRYGWNGHHGASGNLYFFKQSLWPKIKELNLC
jgi:hypothetical protein